MSRRTLIARLAISLGLAAILTVAVGWVKLAAIDKPAFRAALSGCFKDPLCDPSPYITIGWPFVFGVNNDATGSVRMVVLYNAPEEYEGGNYTDDYWGFLLNLLFFGFISFGALWLYRLVQSWLRRRK